MPLSNPNAAAVVIERSQLESVHYVKQFRVFDDPRHANASGSEDSKRQVLGSDAERGEDVSHLGCGDNIA